MRDVLGSWLEFNNHVITAVDFLERKLWLLSTPYLLKTIMYKIL